jgi:ammonia channel protein AmtB
MVSNSWNSHCYWYLLIKEEEKDVLSYFYIKIGFAGTCTALILLPLKYTMGIRLSPEDEMRGLDYIGKMICSFSVYFLLNIIF